jgi:DNA polymerase-3 subunit gamma/tau
MKGQEHVVQLLAAAISKRRVPHAFLFAGPRGVGKTSMARLLAKALNCRNRKEGDYEPCGECPNCRQITAGSFQDVVELDGASHGKVENARELKDSLVYTAAAGKYRVFIVDECHRLTPSAFDALLKSLEEPPAHVKFILCTTERHKVPITVLSRCQRFDFRRVAEGQIFESLQDIVQAEARHVANEVLLQIARQSDGSLRDALSLLESLLALEGEISFERAAPVLGVEDYAFLEVLWQQLEKHDLPALLQSVAQFHEGGHSASNLVAQLLDMVRTKLIAAKSPQPLLLAWADILLETQRQLEFYTNARFILELTLIKLATTEPLSKQIGRQVVEAVSVCKALA